MRSLRYFLPPAIPTAPALLVAAIASAGAAEAQPSLPNLVVSEVDASGVMFDCQTREADGPVLARITNQGSVPTGADTAVFLFEDGNGNGTFETATDPVFAIEMVAGGLAPGDTATVAIDLSETLAFAGNILYALADAGDAVAESDETDNLAHSGLFCQFVPPPGAFDPVIQWSWESSAVLPDHLNVMSTPGVLDLNGDGISDIVFGATDSRSGDIVQAGVLRALSGDNGAELFTVTDPDLAVNILSSVAVGDLDGDLLPEIVASNAAADRLIAFENDGTLKWRSPILEPINVGAPALADLDADGIPEIVLGRQVLNADGTLRWTGTGGKGTQALTPTIDIGPLAAVADLDLDGVPEVVAGNTAYTATGAILWQNSLTDGYPALGNFDDDPFPEIVLVTQGTVYLLEHDGTTKWGPLAVPGGGAGGPATVADYDADGEPEIGVAGAVRYSVIETVGTIKWETVTQDGSSNRTGSSVFDFDGDGAAEVVYRDELFLRVYRGVDGFVLLETPMSSCTGHEYVLVADVDADGHAEIVAVANDNCGFGPQRGVFVLRDSSDRWVSTRRIWNQHTYHITNIDDDGTIPAVEANNWDTYNNYRKNDETFGSPLAAPDLTASFIRTETGSCPDSVSIVGRIGNGGANVAVSPVSVAFYDGDPVTGTLLGVAPTDTRLEPGLWQDVTLTLSPAPAGPRTICVVADDDGFGDGAVNECNEQNNVCCTDFIDLCSPDGTCGCEGKVTRLTLQYQGDVSDARIRVVQKKDGAVVFDDIVQPGGQFSFRGQDKKGTLTTEIRIYVNGRLDTRIHTSCSQPIGPGLAFGSFEVIAGESREGGFLCPGGGDDGDSDSDSGDSDSDSGDSDSDSGDSDSDSGDSDSDSGDSDSDSGDSDSDSGDSDSDSGDSDSDSGGNSDDDSDADSDSDSFTQRADSTPRQSGAVGSDDRSRERIGQRRARSSTERRATRPRSSRARGGRGR